jgi:hypothetical protein
MDYVLNKKKLTGEKLNAKRSRIKYKLIMLRYKGTRNYNIIQNQMMKV